MVLLSAFVVLLAIALITVLALCNLSVRRRVGEIEQALQRSQAQFEAFLRHVPASIALQDRDGRYLLLNDLAVARLGFSSADQILGYTAQELFSPEVAQLADADRRQMLESGEPITREYRFSMPDGPHAAISYGFPTRDLNGQVSGVGYIATDITERMLMEEALRASEERFRQLAFHSPDFIYIVDIPTWKLIYTNRDQFLGYTLEELSQQDAIRAAVHPADHSAAFDYWSDLWASLPGTVTTVEYRLRRQDGPWEWLQRRATLIPPADSGKPTQAIVLVSIITEQKEAQARRLELERQLFEAQRLESIGVLAGGIAHDFNNLLTPILGHAELLLSEQPAQSAAATSAQAIVTGARRASELVNQLLAYAGKGRFLVQPIEINSLIREMDDLLYTSTTRRALIHTQLEEPLPAVLGDATQIRQVILNLMLNAAEAIGDTGGSITISTAVEDLDQAALTRLAPGAGLRTGPYVRLRVADTGIGMDELTMQRVFEPFFSTKFTGRGLGLAAVQGIIRSHQGILHVESDYGRGSVFSAWLPTTDQSPTPEETQADMAQQPQSGSVLIIDDEESVRSVISRMVERIGYVAYSAPSGPAGLALLDAGLPDLICVFLDLTMPHMGGDVVAREIARQWPGTLVVLMSGYSAEEIGQRYLDLALAGVVQKPFSFERLRAICAEMIALRG